MGLETQEDVQMKFNFSSISNDRNNKGNTMWISNIGPPTPISTLSMNKIVYRKSVSLVIPESKDLLLDFIFVDYYEHNCCR